MVTWYSKSTQRALLVSASLSSLSRDYSKMQDRVLSPALTSGRAQAVSEASHLVLILHEAVSCRLSGDAILRSSQQGRLRLFQPMVVWPV
jgi:hypothetical protein